MPAHLCSSRSGPSRPGAGPFAALLALGGLLAALAQPVRAQAIGPLDFVDGFESVPAGLLADVGALLPEQPNGAAAFAGQAFPVELRLEQPAFVRLTLLAAPSSLANTLGYVTYSVDPLTILDRQLVLPDLSHAGLASGDVTTLRDAAGLPRLFAAGTRIGFFVVADGWNDADIQGWDALSATVPSLDPAANLTRPTSLGTFTSLDAVNPELAVGSPGLARHAALMTTDALPDAGGALLLGLEERLRTVGDSDFNDAVLLVRSDPPDAFDTTGLLAAVTGDPDLDGVSGSADAYPYDDQRATIAYLPAKGWNALGLEDGYPLVGDGDYNDTVVVYRFELVLRADGRVKDARGSFQLVARGGSLIHRLGLHLPGLPDDASGSVTVVRQLGDAAQTQQSEPPLSVQDLVALHGRRLETLVPNSHHALPAPPAGVFVNTASAEPDGPGACSLLTISFDEPITRPEFGQPPFDLYWMVYDGVQWVDVHQVGMAAFDDRPPGLPDELGETAFVDDAGYPWLLEVPYGWRFPLEHRFIGEAYPGFVTWAASHGTQASDWYQHPVPSKVGAPLDALLPTCTWNTAEP